MMRLAFGALAAALSVGVAASAPTAGRIETMTVYKSPTCGCCAKWVDHVRRSGFKVVVHDQDDLSETKASLGVAREIQSCHTAVVGRYVIEGHVPADLVQRLLKDRPAVVGLAVPGMPQGSPGMEGARKVRYDVLTFDRTGKTTVYATR